MNRPLIIALLLVTCLRCSNLLADDNASIATTDNAAYRESLERLEQLTGQLEDKMRMADPQRLVTENAPTAEIAQADPSNATVGVVAQHDGTPWAWAALISVVFLSLIIVQHYRWKSVVASQAGPIDARPHRSLRAQLVRFLYACFAVLICFPLAAILAFAGYDVTFSQHRSGFALGAILWGITLLVLVTGIVCAKRAR